MNQNQSNPDNQDQPAKKPIFRRWWFWAIVVVVAIAALGGSRGSKDPAADSSPSAAVTSTPEPTPTPIQPSSEPESSVGVTDAPKASDSSGDDSSVSLDTLCALIKANLIDNYSGCEVTHDDESITVNVWLDGLAMELALTQESNSSSSKDAWETAKTNTATLAGTICELIDTAGREDVYLVFNVLNDQNHDNVVLSILEDTVIYDVLA